MSVSIEISGIDGFDLCAHRNFSPRPAGGIDQGVPSFFMDKAVRIGISQELNEFASVIEPNTKIEIPISIDVGGMPWAPLRAQTEDLHSRKSEISETINGVLVLSTERAGET